MAGNPLELFRKFFGAVRAICWPPAVESSIAVEDAVENRGLYRVFCFALVLKGFGDTIAPLSRG